MAKKKALLSNSESQAKPLIRIQKFLSKAGICSRRKGEQLIREGQIKVNGRIVTLLGTKIDPESDQVEVGGRSITNKPESIYIALNKPKGYISSCKHPGRKIILDLIDIKERIYPVGRLDYDSNGLLLLTNDGKLHQQLTHPSYDHEKEYDVTVQRPLTDKDLRMLSEGIVLDGRITRSAVVKRLSPKRFRIILQEGRKRQIRRMVKYIGNQVNDLKRIRVSNVKLGNLPTGKWRYLTEKEKRDLKKHL